MFKTTDRDVAFRERQRKASLEARLPKAKEKTPEEPIQTIPFHHVSHIKPVNLSDYSNLSAYVRKALSPRDHIAEPITAFMVNMFLNLPDNFYGSKKSYSKREREFTREQLGVFRNSLNVLEVICDSGYTESWGNTGLFNQKQTYNVGKVKEIVGTDIWDGKLGYHLIHIKNPSRIALDRGAWYAEGMAREIVEKRYEDKLEECDSYVSKIEDEKEIEELEKRISDSVDDAVKKQLSSSAEEKDSYKIFSEICEECLRSNQDLTKLQKDFLEKTIEGIQLKIKIEEEIKDEIPKLPDEIDIVARLSKNLTFNGVLILESSKIKDIPGLGHIASYEHASLYQKR